jgi:heme/copper-type cytochrome/quinol oxidase subunit 4
MNRLRTSATARVNAIWVLTLGLTLIAVLLASGDHSGRHLSTSTAEAMAVLGLAAIKVFCIIWDFMEVRAAPRWLRQTAIGWLVGLWLTIAAIYLS